MIAYVSINSRTTHTHICSGSAAYLTHAHGSFLTRKSQLNIGFFDVTRGTRLFYFSKLRGSRQVQANGPPCSQIFQFTM